MTDGIQFSELLDYTEEESERWKQFFSRHPEALDLSLDIAGNVRQLVLHIFAVELYFANALLGLEKVNPDKLPTEPLAELFNIGEQAAHKYREFFATARSDDWAETVDLGPRLSSAPSKRKLVAQALTHSIRHWAQIATFLRQQGLKQEWPHDFLLSKAMQ